MKKNYLSSSSVWPIAPEYPFPIKVEVNIHNRISVHCVRNCGYISRQALKKIKYAHCNKNMFKILFSTGVTVAQKESILELIQKDLHNEDECQNRYFDVVEVVEDDAYMMPTSSEDKYPNNSKFEDMANIASSFDDIVFSLHSNCSSDNHDNSGSDEVSNYATDLRSKH